MRLMICPIQNGKIWREKSSKGTINSRAGQQANNLKIYTLLKFGANMRLMICPMQNGKNWRGTINNAISRLIHLPPFQSGKPKKGTRAR